MAPVSAGSRVKFTYPRRRDVAETSAHYINWVSTQWLEVAAMNKRGQRRNTAMSAARTIAALMVVLLAASLSGCGAGGFTQQLRPDPAINGPLSTCEMARPRILAEAMLAVDGSALP